MKCCEFAEFGKPEEVVKEAERPSPTRGKGKVKLRVLYAPINPADINFIEGRYGVKPELPAVPGMEGCAEVLEADGEDFPVGTRVIFLRRGGSWREELVCDPADLIAVPDKIDPLQASMLGVNPLTAWCLLTQFEQLLPGDVILQNAANSNVGRCVIQLARQREIVTVNTVRREELVSELKGLGADHVVIDGDPLPDVPSPKLAFNCVGGDSAIRQLKALAPQGRQVTFGAMAKKPLNAPAGLMIFKGLSLTGFWVTEWIKQQAPQTVRMAYEELAACVMAGELEQAVDEVFPMEDVSRALERAQTGGREGKVVLKL